MTEQPTTTNWYPSPAGTPTYQPAWSAPVLTSPPTPKRMPKKVLAITAGVAAAATATVLVFVTRSGDDTASFCRDYQSLASVTNGDFLIDSTATASTLPGRFRKLAAEAPAAAAADLRMLADDMSTLLRTGSGSVDDATAQAAADRVDAVAERTCGGSAGA